MKSKFDSFGNVLQYLAVNGFKFRVSGFPLGKVFVLVVSGKSYLLAFVKSCSLIDHAVIDVPTQSKSRIKFGFLRFGRIQSIFYTENAHICIIQHLCISKL